jgi:hypothetical protein
MVEGLDPEVVVRVIPHLVVIGEFVADKVVGDAYGDRLKVLGGMHVRAEATPTEA